MQIDKLTKEELEYISKPPARLHNDTIWQKAFWLYNKAHPNQRPLLMSCVPCYIKVYHYLKNAD